MKPTSLIRLLLAATLPLVITSCSNSGRVMLSPVPVAQSSYHMQPSQSDSFQHANYLSLSGSFSAIGRDIEDNSQLVQFKFHHAGKAGRFQYFAGIQANAGAYNFNENGSPWIDSLGNRYPNRRSNFVFSGALSGGFGYTIPVSSNFEWRVIGVEGNVGLESGRYFNYRKSVPDSAVNYVDRHRLQGLYFATTEMVFRRRRSGTKVGYQFAVGTNFRRVPYSDSYYDPYDPNYGYGYNNWSPAVVVRNTLHVNKDPMGFYFQIYGGRHLLALNTGLTFRIP